MPEPYSQDGKEGFGFRIVIGVDEATNFILSMHPFHKPPSVLNYAELVPIMDDVIERFGVPNKGFVISHSSWLSSTELVIDEDTSEQGEFLEEIGASFGPMTDSDKDAFRKWADSHGVLMLFDADQIPDYA